MRKVMFSERIAVIGLGRLGAPMAACLAEQGFRVSGVDLDPERVEAVNAGRAPVPEPDLDALFTENRERISATCDHAEAVAETDFCFVIVPTPADAEGCFGLEHAKAALAEIGQAMAAKKSYYLIAMISSVLPGSCRYGLIPILEEHSGKKAGVDFGFCYAPEFVALGRVVRDLLYPDFKLVGELDARSGDTLEDIYARIFRNGAPCSRMSLENAELAKLSLNTYVSMKISFANSLAALCDRVPGGDVDVITEAIGLDRRIGHRYLRGGAPFGGHCFPYETRALAYASELLGVEPHLPGATTRVNGELVEMLVSRVKEIREPRARVTVLGLAYKPGTPEIELSASLELVRRLDQLGYAVSAFDPLAGETARTELPGSVTVEDALVTSLEGAELVLVTTADPVFIALEEDDFAICDDEVVVFDLWRVLATELKGSMRLRYEAFGFGDTSAEETRAVFGKLWGRTESN